MSAVPQPRRPAAPRRLSSGDEGFVLHLPANAFTFDGFRRWVKSDERPDNVRHIREWGDIPRREQRGAVPARPGDCTHDRRLSRMGQVGRVAGEVARHLREWGDFSQHEQGRTGNAQQGQDGGDGGVLGNLDPDAEAGTLYTEGVLISHEGSEVSNNPDGVYLGWEILEAGRVRLVPGKRLEGQFVEMEGPPDWVMEVVSNSSVTKDTRTFRAPITGPASANTG